MKEGGLVQAPGEFTRNVLEQVGEIPDKRAYKPLIGWRGRILIILFVVSIVAISMIFTEPGSGMVSGFIDNLGFLQRDVESGYHFFRDIKFPTGLLSAMVAIFVLVVSDTGFRRRNLV